MGQQFLILFLLPEMQAQAIKLLPGNEYVKTPSSIVFQSKLENSGKPEQSYDYILTCVTWTWDLSSRNGKCWIWSLLILEKFTNNKPSTTGALRTLWCCTQLFEWHYEFQGIYDSL